MEGWRQPPEALSALGVGQPMALPGAQPHQAPFQAPLVHTASAHQTAQTGAMPAPSPPYGYEQMQLHQIANYMYENQGPPQPSPARWTPNKTDSLLLERVFLLERCPGRDLRQQLAAHLSGYYIVYTDDS